MHRALDVLDCFIVNYALPQVTGVKLLWYAQSVILIIQHTPPTELLIAARFMDPHFAHVDFLLLSDKTFHNLKHDHKS